MVGRVAALCASVGAHGSKSANTTCAAKRAHGRLALRRKTGASSMGAEPNRVLPQQH
jgi:hypothetical protein